MDAEWLLACWIQSGPDRYLTLSDYKVRPYSNFRDTIIYSRDTLVLDEVFTALDSKEKMKHITGSRDAIAEGLQARGYKTSARGRYPKPSSEANSKSEGRHKFCNYCKKKGHEIEDCFKLRNKIAEKGQVRWSQSG